MKRKYCLVRCSGELGVNSFVFVVWVGSSLRESVKLSLVEEFCKDCDWYFKRWSQIVDTALELRAKQTRLDGTRCVKPYTMIQMGIDECYQRIIDDSWLEVETNHTMTAQEKFMRFRNDPQYLAAYHRKKRITSCSPSRRNYLSHGMGNAYYGLAAPVACIVILIVLDAIVSNLISSLTF